MPAAKHVRSPCFQGTSSYFSTLLQFAAVFWVPSLPFVRLQPQSWQDRQILDVVSPAHQQCWLLQPRTAALQDPELCTLPVLPSLPGGALCHRLCSWALGWAAGKWHFSSRAHNLAVIPAGEPCCWG